MNALAPVAAWVRGNPTRAVAIAGVIVGWFSLVGVHDAITGGLITILMLILGGPVYAAVAPIAHVVDTTRRAAVDAAQDTAQRLTDETVGGVGELTATAVDIATDSAEQAADGALSALGIPRRDR